LKEIDESEIWNSRPQPIKIKKDQLKPKRTTDDDEKSDLGLDISVGREKTPVIKVQGDAKPFKNYFKKSKKNSFSKLPDKHKDLKDEMEEEEEEKIEKSYTPGPE